MPKEMPKDLIENAEAAVVFAQQVRAFHRRRNTDQRQRSLEIRNALSRLAGAMKPIKSEIGRFPYGPQTITAEANRKAIRNASAAIQRERRKLHKMKQATRGR